MGGGAQESAFLTASQVGGPQKTLWVAKPHVAFNFYARDDLTHDIKTACH